MARKFIITSRGDLRMGDVRMHRDLLHPGDVCLGGGYYAFDYVSNRVVLDRESYDYGAPQWSKLVASKIRLRISKLYQGLDFVWVYASGNGESLIDWLGVEWV
ncbi:MAG: hypothetical protein ACI30R_05100 [Sodaliphilus sp.]